MLKETKNLFNLFKQDTKSFKQDNSKTPIILSYFLSWASGLQRYRLNSALTQHAKCTDMFCSLPSTERHLAVMLWCDVSWWGSSRKGSWKLLFAVASSLQGFLENEAFQQGRNEAGSQEEIPGNRDRGGWMELSEGLEGCRMTSLSLSLLLSLSIDLQLVLVGCNNGKIRAD